jgi:hypothetical protein
VCEWRHSCIRGGEEEKAEKYDILRLSGWLDLERRTRSCGSRGRRCSGGDGGGRRRRRSCSRFAIA